MKSICYWKRYIQYKRLSTFPPYSITTNAPSDQVAVLPSVKAITERWAHNHYNSEYNLTLMWFFYTMFFTLSKEFSVNNNVSIITLVTQSI